jgi:hypothetical protein
LSNFITRFIEYVLFQGFALLVGFLYAGASGWLAVFGLAKRVKKNGIRNLIFSRSDYSQTLTEFLKTADHTLIMISVSLKQANDSAHITKFIERRINGNGNFRVTISVLSPTCSVVEAAARALDMDAEILRGEIKSFLKALLEVNRRLDEVSRARLSIRVHELLPLGSAILLDATPNNGVIQVETKLHGSPRTESFGYLVKGPGEFYMRNHRAWMQFLDDSRPLTPNEIELIL